MKSDERCSATAARRRPAPRGRRGQLRGGLARARRADRPARGHRQAARASSRSASSCSPRRWSRPRRPQPRPKDAAKREAELILAEAHGEARSIVRTAQGEKERLFAEARRVEALLRAASDGRGVEGPSNCRRERRERLLAAARGHERVRGDPLAGRRSAVREHEPSELDSGRAEPEPRRSTRSDEFEPAARVRAGRPVSLPPVTTRTTSATGPLGESEGASYLDVPARLESRCGSRREPRRPGSSAGTATRGRSGSPPPPEDGRANEAVVRLLADTSRCRARDVAVVSGHGIARQDRRGGRHRPSTRRTAAARTASAKARREHARRRELPRAARGGARAARERDRVPAAGASGHDGGRARRDLGEAATTTWPTWRPSTFDRELDEEARGGRAADARRRSTRALARSTTAPYGICERCGKPIGRGAAARPARGRPSASTTSGPRERGDRAVPARVRAPTSASARPRTRSRRSRSPSARSPPGRGSGSALGGGRARRGRRRPAHEARRHEPARARRVGAGASGRSRSTACRTPGSPSGSSRRRRRS